MLEITSQEQLQEELVSGVTTVIDFYAPWCGPCKMMAPGLNALEKDYDDSDVKFVKVNVDEQPEVAAAFNVMSIPAVFVTVGGKVVDNTVGFVPQEAIKETIERAISQISE